MKKVVSALLVCLICMGILGTAWADVYSDAGFIKKIPMKPKYSEACEEKGTVERLTYTTHAYALEAMAAGECEATSDFGDTMPEGLLPEAGTEILVEKELYVYLPYGYTPEKQYNVIYVMHGGGDNASYWLTDDGMGKGTRPVLDNLFKKGDCADTIVVTPTFYAMPDDGNSYGFAAMAMTQYFWKELKNEIIPLVETTYSTYLGTDASPENIIATRDHRGYAGLSMGSITSFHSIMTHCVDYISWIGSFSGAKAEAADLKAALTSDEFKDYPIHFWYNGNGSADMAHDEHYELWKAAMAEMPDRFVDGTTTCWVEFKGGSHAYNCWLPHLYNCMKLFFKL